LPGERQIHLVSLKLKVAFPLGQLSLFFSEVLSALLERVLLQPRLSCHESLLNFVKLSSFLLDFSNKGVVVRLLLLVVVALLGVQVVKFRFVGKADLLDLLLVRVDVVLHFALLCKQLIESDTLLVVLVLDVHVQSFDVVGFGV